MTERWFTARELAELAVPGLPKTRMGIQKQADRDDWPWRPRSGRGGGREYPVSALPDRPRALLMLRLEPAAEATAVAAPRRERTPASLPALADWQREVMDARLALLSEVERLSMTMTLGQAEAARAGTLVPRLARAAALANARRGESRVLSVASLRRWRALRQAGVAAVAPQVAADDAPPEWLWPLMRVYALPSKPSISWAVQQLPEDIRPNLRTAQRVVAGLGALTRNRGRMGPRELKRLRAFTVRSFNELEPLDVITGDGHLNKAEVLHPETGRPMRAELVTWADVATRRAIGWSAGEAESAMLVADALAHAVRSAGVAGIVYTDNGCGFVARHMTDQVTGVMERVGMRHQTAIAYNAQARGVIERLQATLWKTAAKGLPAYVGEEMDREAKDAVYRRSRKELEETGATRVLMTWSQFIDWARSQVDAYNDRPHSTLPKIRDAAGRLRHQTPNERWQEFVASGWSPITLDPQEALTLFRPQVSRKVVRGEVRVWGNRYFSMELERLDLHGEDVLVAYDIHDASKVWVHDREGRYLCAAELDANVVAYFPKAVIEQARERRVAAQLDRLDRKRDAIEAQLGPQPLRLAAESGETVLPAPAVARMADALDGVVPPSPSDGRPDTADDVDLAAWLARHPDRATAQDRRWIIWFLDSPAAPFELQRLARRGADVEVLRRLATEPVASPMTA
ncbi:MAG: DDE-type integrase/transposase/recombinase [Rhizobiales bacterium]|nr:DDE-type integrase/transposase/recombinase [Hyphomicrobiales bacterium]